MLLNLLLAGNLREAMIAFLLLLPAVGICLSVHEFSHGLVAYALGDNTAKNSGRLTLNPLAHLNKAGFLCMLLIGFGWANPVPVNISNFKYKNKKIQMALVAFAGPFSNMLLAIIFIVLSFLASMVSGAFGKTLVMFCQYVSMLSVLLAIFNLIPIYPFDGSRILDWLLPLKYSMLLRKYQSIFMIMLIAIIWFGGLSGVADTVYVALYKMIFKLIFM